MPSDKGFSISIPKRLGGLLVNAKVITEAQLNEVVELQQKQGGKLGNIRIQKGFIDEKPF